MDALFQLFCKQAIYHALAVHATFTVKSGTFHFQVKMAFTIRSVAGMADMFMRFVAECDVKGGKSLDQLCMKDGPDGT